MTVEIDSLDYVDRTMRRRPATCASSSSARRRPERRAVWVTAAAAARVLDPEVLRGLDRFSTAARDATARVGSVDGADDVPAAAPLRGRQRRRLPRIRRGLAALAADVEQLLLPEPDAARLRRRGHARQRALIAARARRGDEDGLPARARAPRATGSEPRPATRPPGGADAGRGAGHAAGQDRRAPGADARRRASRSPRPSSSSPSSSSSAAAPRGSWR